MVKSTQKGQALIEILFAVGIVVVVLVAVASATIKSIQNASFAEASAKAASLVEEGIENARILRDQNTWSDFTTVLTWPLNEAGLGGGLFSRTTTVGDTIPPAANKKVITVTVSWTDSKGAHQRSSETILTLWE